MNTNVQLNMLHPASDIARVAFSMFIYIADVDKSIAAQDVRRFQAQLRETAWVDSDDLRDALHVLQQNYSTFWASYEDGVFPVDIAAIAGGLDIAIRGLPDERATRLRRSLSRFLDRLDGGIGVKLMQSGDQRLRSQARKELLAVLTKRDEENAKHHLPADLVLAGTTVIPPPQAGLQRPDTELLPELPIVASVSLATVAFVPPDQMPVWKGGKVQVRCVSVVWETQDTKTYSFVADPPCLFHYKAGQFVSIEVPLPSSVLRRSYTISSSPSRPYVLSITVKKVPMGWMSNWLFDNMVEGTECAITGPAGKFTCHDFPASKLLFLVAGSGITPAMSMLRWLADTSSPADIVFINNVRTSDDIIFHQELLHMSTRLSTRIRLAIVPAALSPARAWHGPVGRLDETLLHNYVPDFAERETFVCGPPGYMAAAKAMLARMGLPMERYHDESFGGLGAAPATTLPRPSARAASLSGPLLGSAPVPLSPAILPSAGELVPAPPKTTAAAAAPAPTLRPDAATIASRTAITNAALPTSQPPSRSAAIAAAASPAERAPTMLARSSLLEESPSVANLGKMPAIPVPAPVAPSYRAAANHGNSFGASAKPEKLLLPTAPTSPVMPRVTSTARIFLQGQDDNFVVQPGQSILDAAEASGVELAHSCRAGICGACKMRRISGRVDMGEQSCLSPAELESGYVLTCMGKAVGDVTLAP